MTIKLNIRHIIKTIALLTEALALLALLTISREAVTHYATQATTTMQWQADTCWGGWMKTTLNY